MENSNDIFGRILGNGPSQNTVFLVLRKMKEEGEFGQVISECLKALNFYPNDIQLRTLLAETYLEMGIMGQAERELDRITSDIKNLVSAYKLQADIYTRQKRHEEASEALKRYLAFNPDDREALDILARIKPVEEQPEPKTPDIPEEAGPALEEELEEEVKEEIITEPPEVPEEVVSTAEEEIKEEPVPPEHPEEVALVEEEKIEKEPHPKIPEEVDTGGEEEIEGVPDEVTPVAEEEAESFTDLATPTLAEIYYNQGQIHEAINTYEKVILENPEDKASTERLNELKAQIAEKSEIKVTPEDALRARTEKMIAVLEGWLERIQESGHA
ncbi:MAG: tetratricopeptide repeat protein [Deltaproteobacteria bacterium]|nr:tetratricopeptide repeat protein [Deltaproteobacteria bacterium]